MNKQTNEVINRRFTRLLIPAVISSIGMGFAETADAVVIGQKMGETGLAIVGIVLPVFMFINILAYGFSTGGSIKYGILIGEDNKEGAREQYNAVLTAVLLMGVFLAAIGNALMPQLLSLLGADKMSLSVYEGCKTYLRIIITGFPVLLLSYLINSYMCNDDNQVLASVGFVMGCVTDLTLNFILVIVFGIGADGAAIATVAGQSVAIFIYIIGLKFRKNSNLKLKFFRFNKARMKMVIQAFKNGFSTSVQYFWQLIFILVVNHSLINRVSETEVAIFDIIQNVLYIIYFIYEGTGKAMQPLVSMYYGKRNLPACKYTRNISFISGTTLGGLMAVICCVFAKNICKIMGITDVDTMVMAIRDIRVTCTSVIFGGINVLAATYYQACEKEKSVWIIVTLRTAVVLIPCAVLMIYTFRENCWWFYLVTEVISIALWLLWRMVCNKFERREDCEKITKF